jgi:hypothetical protein
MLAAATLPTCAPALTAAPRGTARARGRSVATATAAAPNTSARQATLRSQPQQSVTAVSVSLGERARGLAAAGFLAAALLVTPAAFAEECQKSCEAGAVTRRSHFSGWSKVVVEDCGGLRCGGQCRFCRGGRVWVFRYVGVWV